MKKAVLIILSVLITAGSVFAQTGDDFDIEQLQDGTLRITRYMGPKLSSIIIPRTIEGIRVTEIGREVSNTGLFEDRKEITSVTIPEGITTISHNTFLRCKNLTSITLPNSIKTIWTVAFKGTGLTSITLPESVTLLGGGVFQNCENLVSITIKGRNSLASDPRSNDIRFKYNATDLFGGCPNIKCVTLPDNCSFGDDVFPNNFYNFYVSQGKKAGTFIWTGRIWRVGTAAEAEQIIKDAEAKLTQTQQTQREAPRNPPPPIHINK